MHIINKPKMTPDLTSVISSSDLLKYLILIKTIDTHLLLSSRTFISLSVYEKSSLIRHLFTLNPKYKSFCKKNKRLDNTHKIPAPIIQHLYREKQKGPDYLRNQGPYQKRQLPTLPHCIAVPSAQPGLTSLFGMGRGGTPAQ